MNTNTFEEIMKFIIENQNKYKNGLIHNIDAYGNFEKLYFFDTDKLYELIEKTDAWKLNRDFEDIEYIIKRMKKCISDFKEKAEKLLDEEIFLDGVKITEYEDEFTEISYLFTSYTYTLFKIRTVIQEKYSLSDYINKAKSIFSADAVGNLIKAIRHTSVHRTLYRPRGYIKYKLPGKEAYITIDKKSLLKDDNLNGKELINKIYGENINMIKLFEEYIQKVELFHGWHKEEIVKCHSDKIEEYKKYTDWLNGLNERAKTSFSNTNLD